MILDFLNNPPNGQPCMLLCTLLPNFNTISCDFYSCYWFENENTVASQLIIKTWLIWTKFCQNLLRKLLIVVSIPWQSKQQLLVYVYYYKTLLKYHLPIVEVAWKIYILEDSKISKEEHGII